MLRIPTTSPMPAAPGSGGPRAPASDAGTIPGTRSRAQGALALVLYLAVSVVLFGRSVLGHMTTSYVGAGPDPQIFIWGLRWWPWAVVHGVDPFYSHVLWAPVGVDVTWTTSVPGAALLALPVTLTAGPTAAWNVLCLAAPALTAFTAFLLCRLLCRSFAAALVGGYLFGFSTYELGAMEGHLHLSLVFLVPLAVYLFIRRVRGELSARRFTVALTAALTLQFLLSPEIMATALGSSVLGLACAWLFMSPLREALVRAGALCALALAVSGVLVSPLAVHMFLHAPARALNPSVSYSADLLNFVVPTRITELGGRSLRAISTRFTGNHSEQAAYLGFPLLFIVAGFAWRERGRASTRLLGAVAGGTILASLGPVLQVDGHRLVWLPGALLAGLPVLDNALPSRLMMYTDLVVSIVVALWLSRAGVRRVRWLWSAVAIVCLLPSLSWPGWHADGRIAPQFIASHAYRTMIAPGDTVLFLPFAYRGDAMRAQAEADMYFGLAGGATQPMPAAYRRLSIAGGLDGGHTPPGAPAALARLISAESVDEVVIDRAELPRWRRLLAGLSSRPSVSDDALVYAVSAAARIRAYVRQAESVRRP